MSFAKDTILNLAHDIKKAGYRPFIAENGTYGFYTDKEGSKVISFGIDLLRIRFSGNYVSECPQSTGTGWGIGDNREDFGDMFKAIPERYAVGGWKWKFTTLEQHLKTYGPSSRYKEVTE